MHALHNAALVLILGVVGVVATNFLIAYSRSIPESILGVLGQARTPEPSRRHALEEDYVEVEAF